MQRYLIDRLIGLLINEECLYSMRKIDPAQQQERRSQILATGCFTENGFHATRALISPGNLFHYYAIIKMKQTMPQKLADWIPLTPVLIIVT